MSHPNIIITGEAGHGKDTVGLHLINKYGYVRTAFADALKNEVCGAYHEDVDINIQFLNHRTTKEIPSPRLALRHCIDPNFITCALTAFEAEDGASLSTSDRLALPRSPRRITQIWGTEYRRATCDTYWVDVVSRFIENSSQPVVICDGRFHNECGWALDQHVERLHVYKTAAADAKVASHSSENIPPPCAQTISISNDITDDNFASLHQCIDEALFTFSAKLRKPACSC